MKFICALFPGVGHMYLGQLKKGIQLLALFLIIGPVLRLVGLGYIATVLKLVIWCYCFFDTLDTAKRQERGEYIPDWDFVFNKYVNNNGQASGGFSLENLQLNKKAWMTGAWILILVGVLAILNITFSDYEIYGIIKSYVSIYFLPAVLIIGGIYMLFRGKK